MLLWKFSIAGTRKPPMLHATWGDVAVGSGSLIWLYPTAHRCPMLVPETSGEARGLPLMSSSSSPHPLFFYHLRPPHPPSGSSIP
jgi:hypothetical protein